MKPQKRKSVEIEIPKAWIDQFKREAKNLFPKECYALLLGTSNGGKKKVEWMMFPDLEGNYSDEYHVSVQASWWRHAEEIAKAKGLMLLGDLHSHCWDVGQEIKDHSPSQVDWEGSDRNYVLGICTVSKLSNGKLKSSVYFWEMPPKTKVKISG